MERQEKGRKRSRARVYLTRSGDFYGHVCECICICAHGFVGKRYIQVPRERESVAVYSRSSRLLSSRLTNCALPFSTQFFRSDFARGDRTAFSLSLSLSLADLHRVIGGGATRVSLCEIEGREKSSTPIQNSNEIFFLRS